MKTITSYINLYYDIFKLGLSKDHTNLTICDVLFICHDVDRPVKLNGVAYAPLIDSIREEFENKGLQCISIAHYGSKLTGNKSFGYSMSLNRKFLYYLIIGRLFSFLGLDNMFEKPSFYKYLFERTKPKIVIAIGAPENLCSAAHAKNILAVELLHGTGYKFIPWGWAERSSDNLPKVILSLDEVSTVSFLPLSKKGVNIFTIPNPFLKRFLPGNVTYLPAEWKYPYGFGFKKRMIISLSVGYSGDHGIYTEFADIIKDGYFYQEVLDLISVNSDVFWCIRLHPVQLNSDKYSDLRIFLDQLIENNANCEWILSSSLPFPVVAANCSGNITMASMSCYDAAAMGVPSLMLCPTIQSDGVHKGWFQDLVEEGYVTKAHVSLDYLNSWVSSIDRLPPRIANLYDDESWLNACEWMFKASGIEKK